MNTQTQEALKMEIEAFDWEKVNKKCKVDVLTMVMDFSNNRIDASQLMDAIAYRCQVVLELACKEALAQPAQEPIKDHCVHLGIDICKNKGVCKYCSPPKIDLPRLNHYNADFTRCGIQHKGKMYLFVADTHPAPSWQGLSDDEIDDISICEQISPDRLWHIYVAIEQALKEKNT